MAETISGRYLTSANVIIGKRKSDGDLTEILVDDLGRVITTDNIAAIDAFGRKRVSTPETIIDSKQLHDKAPLIWDEELVNGGTATHSQLNANTVLAVTNSGDAVIRQTKQRFNYQPGKSQSIKMTGSLSNADNSSSVLGLCLSDASTPFNITDGIYFECLNSILNVVIEKNNIRTVVTQTDWNIDKFDGTGDSGFIIDATKLNVFFIDFEWLSAGDVRMGFFITNKLFYCHSFF